MGRRGKDILVAEAKRYWLQRQDLLIKEENRNIGRRSKDISVAEENIYWLLRQSDIARRRQDILLAKAKKYCSQ